ncbi:MAG: methyltransferase domain-containing protein [Verrucomicrobiota bacterium]
MPDPASAPRACWCGEKSLFAYSDEFHVCKACGTLVTAADVKPADLAVTQDAGELYSKDYWLKRQSERYGLPPLDQRARLDLPERCVHWLNLLLKRRLPPAKVLEIGCAHGGYVALMRWAGYDASGTEMSPWIVQFAKQTFGVPVQAGRIEELAFASQSLDVIILNDVIEHLPDPAATLGHCAKLLKPDGFFVIQTPEYKEHLSYADILATGDKFIEHMRGKADEHLHLFSRRATQQLWTRLGFPAVAFENPIFSYDLFYTASRTDLPENPPDAIAAALAAQPAGRLVLALLDKAYESNDRWWAIQRLEARLHDK